MIIKRIRALIQFLILVLTLLIGCGMQIAYAITPTINVLDGAKIDIALYELYSDSGNTVEDYYVYGISPVYKEKGVDISESSYPKIEQNIDGEWYTASEAVITIKLAVCFDYTSSCSIFYEGNSDVYDITLITDSGERYGGNLVNGNGKPNFEVDTIKDVTAISIQYGRAVDTLTNAYLEVYADTIKSENNASDVLTDLNKDSSFNILDYPVKEDYPVKGDDYPVQIIQIAESTDGELLIYTYQPYGVKLDLRACSINIARQENNINETDFSNYSLKYLNSSGVFYKYKVVDFVLSKEATRIYNISNILRPFNENIDDQPSADNTTSEIPNKVNQLWTATTANNTVSYELIYSETVTILNKTVGFKRYSRGWHPLYASKCDGHFVAFSTDKKIDKLISAKVSFTTQDYSYYKYTGMLGIGNKENTTLSDPVNHELEIHSEDKANSSGNWFHNYTWNRIEKVSDFLANEVNANYTITSEGAEALDKCQWVLRFYETDYFYEKLTNDTNEQEWDQYTFVNDVMILQLEFEADGTTYKLGAVDNKQTGSREPMIYETENNFWKIALLIIAVLIVIGIIYSFVEKEKNKA